MATAADVPGKYDLVINSQGYILSNVVDNSLPFRIQRASYTFSPTFVERSNIQGDYGDNQQDFWMTFSQKDWSEGEQQKYYRLDVDQSRKFWRGSNIDVRMPGQVVLRKAVNSVSFATAVQACAPWRPSGAESIIAASTTKLYEIDVQGSITDRGAHGLGATPSRYGITTDSVDTYVSTTAAGTVGVRKWDGASYSTFSASGADVLVYVNNTLYGLRQDSNGDLVRWDSGGTLTSIFSWKQIDGGNLFGSLMHAYGGKLMIVVYSGDCFGAWVFDGTAPSKVVDFPSNFSFQSMEVTLGIVFYGGVHLSRDGSGVAIQKPAIYYYANGTLGLLWEADVALTSTSAASPGLAPVDGGLLFSDDTSGRLMFYDLRQGGFHAIGTYAVANGQPVIAASATTTLMTRNATTAYQYPSTTSVVSSGTVATSLTDYDTSLDKYFKAVKIDADIPAGASIDIAYRLNDVDGAYTSIQTGASPGTEYTIGQNGRSISIQVTLNKGSSTNGPTLKRIYVRASPHLQTFRRGDYILDLSGRDGKNHVALRDGTQHSKDGLSQAQDLNTAAVATTPFSITDRFGTFTGIIEPDGFELDEVRPEEFVGRVRVREV